MSKKSKNGFKKSISKGDVATVIERMELAATTWEFTKFLWNVWRVFDDLPEPVQAIIVKCVEIVKDFLLS